MSIFTDIGPLQWNMQIVDRDGRPTPEFARYFQQLYENTSVTENGKQDADGDLDGLSDLTGTGLVTRIADELYTVRTILGGDNVTVENGNGVSGNITISVTMPTSALVNMIPLVDGAEPPSLVSDGAGQLILIPWTE